MIYNIRGTHGSGKSYSMHTLLSKHSYEEIHCGDEALGLWVPDLNLRIIGLYEISSGGCDWFLRMVPCPEGQTPSEMMAGWVETFHEGGKYNVLLEGFMVSGTFGRWNDLAVKMQDNGKETWRFLCLDTPAEQCIEHVRGRRARRGNHKPFDPVHLYKHHAQVQNNRQSLIDAGRVVFDIPWHQAPEHIEYILKNDQPRPYGRCPVCERTVASRERRPNGNDLCVAGHTYPSREALEFVTHNWKP